jgi:hypothetical protein
VMVLVGPVPERVATRDTVAIVQNPPCESNSHWYHAVGTRARNCYPMSYPKGIIVNLFWANSLIKLATPTGFEPATLRLGI